ncbi:MAG: 4-hydroxy-tetrahydrodipicolinate synthase [Elusimicrobia bacterium]|nr:4-hydroxy-tetrahydrodipicolinate synthase [Elusimicrobiota bacterium]
MLKLQGSYAAVITPFKNGKVDEQALRKIIRFHLNSKTSGILACGSTGEAAALSQEEYLEVIGITADEAKGKIPVLAGTGTNSTWKSVEMIKKAEKTGADGLLAIVPYYNKPTQDGMFIHFREAAESTRLPVILYNIPGRTGVNMMPQTVLKLRQACKNIIGIKEASGNLDQVSEIINILDKDFSVMSGDDSLTLPMMSVGARGVISVIANIMPDETAKMTDLFFRCRIKDAALMHRKLFPVIKTLFIETNPIPVKYAMHLMGFCEPEPRLPLTVLSKKSRQILKQVMLKAGIKLQ